MVVHPVTLGVMRGSGYIENEEGMQGKYYFSKYTL